MPRGLHIEGILPDEISSTKFIIEKSHNCLSGKMQPRHDASCMAGRIECVEQSHAAQAKVDAGACVSMFTAPMTSTTASLTC